METVACNISGLGWRPRNVEAQKSVPGGSMKRALFSILALATVAVGTAQSNFTIVRPADGAKIRETVRILFPMNSVPESGGYVGIFLNGKFIEAVKPLRGQQYLYYELNTKARGIADGKLDIEAVLYQNFENRPRILDRSSVQVTVANSASIPVPPDGFTIKYKFRPGTEWVYRVEQRVAVNSLSEGMASTANVADLLTSADVETFRLRYSIDNAYPNGDGLIRIQPLPQPGQKSAVITTLNSEVPTEYQDYQMAPVYMRVAPNGREEFGSIPRYFPISGSGGEAQRTDLYGIFPLPVFSALPQRPGSSWSTSFQIGDVELEKAAELTQITTKDIIPARGELVSVEWERGHPCVRIRHTLEQRQLNQNALASQSRVVQASKIEENIYFALDLGTVIYMTRDYTIDVRQNVQTASGGSGGSGGSGPSRTGASGAGGSSSGGPGAATSEFSGPVQPPLRGFIQRPSGPQRGGQPARSGAQGQGQTRPGTGANFGGGASNQATRIVRTSVQMAFILEK
jgi:uncharacterized membrane protein YgcG